MEAICPDGRERRRWLPFRVPRLPLPGLGLVGTPARLVLRRGRRSAAAQQRSHFVAAKSLTIAGASAAASAAALAQPPVATLTAALPPIGAAPAMAAPCCRAAPPRGAAAATAAAAAAAAAPTASSSPRVAAKPATRPASDVLAGALARAASQSIIHPLDTLKVRLQANVRGGGAAAAAGPAAAPSGVSKFGRLVPPPGAGGQLHAAGGQLASLYKGVVGAASGAGIAIGAYFAFYSAACNVMATHTQLAPGAVAFLGGAVAAAGSSVVKVPLAVCIRSVQAGVYPNVFAAASSITHAAGPRGLFTGYWPTLLEDVPDMACKFAAYESMRQLHRTFVGGRDASPGEDFAMGALAGAAAAAATTPLDVVKTRMMCAAASRPTMAGAAAAVLANGGPGAFFAGVGARALSNGINSAVFFCAFEAIRSSFATPRPLPAAPALTLEHADGGGGGGRAAALAVAPLELPADGEAVSTAVAAPRAGGRK
ncbi:mitochondrial carrier protein [Raphidocelis subcapitata]|uniref:Mitochondrial carrier protein n=1 Tax=Raphidocelis subcapitata TaxID=307507 RepID=A0A2V0PC41_9CHLO|nr:mitochondrial carrier protein [Raphidocelis subcapitata]|eukprot:GBF94675.1 mitochondrial carrier protein [Raphidocelis subcapitata]